MVSRRCAWARRRRRTGYQLAAGPGATLRFTHTLTGAGIAHLPGSAATATTLAVTLPAASDAWRAGFYTVKALLGSGAQRAHYQRAVPRWCWRRASTA